MKVDQNKSKCTICAKDVAAKEWEHNKVDLEENTDLNHQLTGKEKFCAVMPMYFHSSNWF